MYSAINFAVPAEAGHSLRTTALQVMSIRWRATPGRHYIKSPHASGPLATDN